MSLKPLGLALVVLLFLIFILQNTGAVAVQFLFWKISMSLALWLILAFVLGFLVGLPLLRSKPRDKKIPLQ